MESLALSSFARLSMSTSGGLILTFRRRRRRGRRRRRARFCGKKDGEATMSVLTCVCAV